MLPHDFIDPFQLLAILSHIVSDSKQQYRHFSFVQNGIKHLSAFKRLLLGNTFQKRLLQIAGIISAFS